MVSREGIIWSHTLAEQALHLIYSFMGMQVISTSTMLILPYTLFGLLQQSIQLSFLIYSNLPLLPLKNGLDGEPFCARIALPA